MSDLVVIVYPSEQKAEEVRKRLFELQKEYLIKLGDAVIATKSSDGQIQLHQVVKHNGIGCTFGQFLGFAHRRSFPQSDSWGCFGRGGRRARRRTDGFRH
jgi:uncharacterized membrane protein